MSAVAGVVHETFALRQVLALMKVMFNEGLVLILTRNEYSWSSRRLRQRDSPCWTKRLADHIHI
uniref:Uncharacterized protein n=1 Tax=Hyaloperonospora arabidopsidis (strain Emoy2) TaxID=559515 RepID=M4BMR9_HYAAE